MTTSVVNDVALDSEAGSCLPPSDPRLPTEDFSRVTPLANSHELLQRIRAEFLEMPGVCLTMPQARRLWHLEPHACETLLTSLIASRFLRRNTRGLFVLHTPRRVGGPFDTTRS